MREDTSSEAWGDHGGGRTLGRPLLNAAWTSEKVSVRWIHLSSLSLDAQKVFFWQKRAR